MERTLLLAQDARDERRTTFETSSSAGICQSLARWLSGCLKSPFMALGGWLKLELAAVEVLAPVAVLQRSRSATAQTELYFDGAANATEPLQYCLYSRPNV